MQSNKFGQNNVFAITNHVIFYCLTALWDQQKFIISSFYGKKPNFLRERNTLTYFHNNILNAIVLSDGKLIVTKQ